MGIVSLQQRLREATAQRESGFLILDRRVSLASAFSDLNEAVVLAEVQQQRSLREEDFLEQLRFVEDKIVDLKTAGDVEMAEDSFKAYCSLLNRYGLS